MLILTPALIPLFDLIAGIGGAYAIYKIGGEIESSLDIKNRYPVNLTNTYKFLTQMFKFSISDTFKNKKVYGYYIYSLLSAQQNLLLALKKISEEDKFIEYYKNTIPDWESKVLDLRKDIDNTYIRYLCYETFFKNVYGIDFKEKNIDIIREKIIPFDKLSETQLNSLRLLVIDPLFNGFFDVDLKDILVLACYADKLCEIKIVSDFPLPPLAEVEKRKFPERRESIIDSIRPWLLYNSMVLTRELGRDLLNTWGGFIDSGISMFTGINQSYTIKAGKVGEDIKNTALDFMDDVKKGIKDLSSSLGRIPQNISSTSDALISTAKTIGIGVGALLVLKLLMGSGEE